MRGNLTSGFAINKDADQPALLCRLISTYAIRSLGNIIPILLTIFKLLSVAKQTGLSLALLETPKTGFVASWPIHGR